MANTPEQISLAIVEVIPVGGSSAQGIKNNPNNKEGLQTSDYKSVPRVLSLISPASHEGEILLCTYSLDMSSRFRYNGIPASLTILRKGSHYLSYMEHPATRGAFYVPRILGENDGLFGSKSVSGSPSAITES